MEPEQRSESRHYCSECGAELPAGAKFCCACGKPTDLSAEPQPVDASLVSSVQSRRAVWVVAAIVVALVIAGVAAGGIVMAQNRAAVARQAQTQARVADLKQLQDAFVKVQSATSVGVTFQNYGPLVTDAAAALSSYNPPDPQAKTIADDFSSALDSYKLASDVWNEKIQDTFSGSAWAAEHPEAAYMTADEAIQHYWQAADTDMSAAQALIAKYDQTAK